jgi:hypothetical protein
MRKLLLVFSLLVASCSKEDYCGRITGGGYDEFFDSYYLRVDGRRELVDEKTYDSFFVNDLICFEYGW